MNPWSNIEISAQDAEITETDKFESSLNDISDSVRKIRELITRFEVCHFKYLQHFKYIRTSITNLEPITDPGKIGSNHIKNGEKAWINDNTGRSLIGQQYLWILKQWLGSAKPDSNPDPFDKNLGLKVTRWLGRKTSDKERIIRLLIARLTYDWESYEKLQQGGQLKDLEYQTCRMDICHYAFPDHLNTLIQAIGRLKPCKDPEGCGSTNPEIRNSIKEKFSELCLTIREMSDPDRHHLHNKNDRMRVWLLACLAKTIKEQTGITDPLPKLL